jgi:LPPG:FO 2-phospho-L-lactate transferase
MILGVPDIADALRSGPGPIVGLSPIVGGAPVRGMADACLSAIGVETSAEAVGRHYGARSAGGLLDGWLIDSADTADVPGVSVRAVPLLMTDVPATAAMAQAALDLAGVGQ